MRPLLQKLLWYALCSAGGLAIGPAALAQARRVVRDTRGAPTAAPTAAQWPVVADETVALPDTIPLPWRTQRYHLRHVVAQAFPC